ncbi:type I-E CRISPR-associated protein Cse2/CasB [Nocardia transvalensis]|uniref:type I-E CRISPR-associated protein Cse2/CasB n=1 Tax=Nocardia transvalensis TaxID=37333 RepID=UPI001894272D|nr:type I-E CRISPR-associated protein Cse2/CasB [Nocardia transvalensis]MBF6331871.1 type I-E CRISPR-associated protein Cse2/CasB [Nocardia transvalensis]
MVAEVIHAVNSSSGSRAALRRALRHGPDSEQARNAHRIVAPYLPAGAGQAAERAFYAVASMIAAQPRNARDDARDNADAGHVEDPGEVELDADSWESRQTLGQTLGRAAALGKVEFDSMEKHLHLLCRQHLHGIHQHLPRLVMRLRAELVEIDWPRLVVDLADWPYGRDRIAKRWLQDFYRTHHALTAGQKKTAAKNSESSESEDQ